MLCAACVGFAGGQGVWTPWHHCVRMSASTIGRYNLRCGTYTWHGVSTLVQDPALHNKLALLDRLICVYRGCLYSPPLLTLMSLDITVQVYCGSYYGLRLYFFGI
jgi:hypothetical protein